MLLFALTLGAAFAACPTPQLDFVRAPTCVDTPVFSVDIAEDVCHPSAPTSCGACNGTTLCGGKDWATCFAATGCTEQTSFRLSNGTAVLYFEPGCTGATAVVTDCQFGFINVCGDGQVNFASAIAASQCVPPGGTTSGTSSGFATSGSSASSGSVAGSSTGTGSAAASSTAGGGTAGSTAASSTAGEGGVGTTASTGAPPPPEPPVASAAARLAPW